MSLVKDGAPLPNPPRKARQFALISYLDESCIQYCLQKNLSRVRHWAYILHDKDVKDDGTPKEPHYHVLVWTVAPTTIAAVRRWFEIPGVEANTLGQVAGSGQEIVDYMTHENDSDKFHYPQTAVVSDDWQWFKSKSEQNTSVQLLDDLLRGVSYYDLCKVYGREFIINRHRYEEMAEIIRGDFDESKKV